MTSRLRRALLLAAALGACSAGPVMTVANDVPDVQPTPPAELPCDPCHEPPVLTWHARHVEVDSRCARTVELYRRTIPGGPSGIVMICDVPCADTSVAPGAIYAYAVAAPGTGVRSAEAYVDTTGTSD